MRDIWLFLHILSAAAWIGAGLFAVFIYPTIARSGSQGGTILKTLEAMANRYFGPAAGLTLLTGIILVWTQDPWEWGDAFVLIGLGVFVFSAVWQPLVASKGSERLLAAATGEGGDVSSALGPFYRNSVIELGVLVFALYAMVSKLGA